MLVVDDFSCFMWIEMLRTKDEALSCLKKSKERAEVDQEGKLKSLRNDRRGEFNSSQFSIFCSDQGIMHYTTTPYSPQENGVVERRNQSVVEMARCLLKSKGVPPRYWGEAVSTTMYLLNRSPTKSVQGKTPYEAWHGRKPQVAHLRTFGCIKYVKKIGPEVDKLADRSIRMVMLGYEPGTKGYRMVDPITEKLCISRDVKFEEDEAWHWDSYNKAQSTEVDSDNSNFQFQFIVPGQAILNPADTCEEGESSGSGEVSSVSPLPQSLVTPQNSQIQDIPSGSQAQNPGSVSVTNHHSHPSSSESSGMVPVKYKTLTNLFENTKEILDYEYNGVCMLAVDEHVNVETALKSQKWREAMKSKLHSIEDNNTLFWSDLPRGHKAIGLKWVFKLKKDDAGNDVKHKTRLVAKGYALKEGVDYDEVFVPVARLDTIRVLLALCHTRVLGAPRLGREIITNCAGTKSHTYDDSWYRNKCHIFTIL
jgi:hypothetical protein